jgi:hypothetical protein
VQCLVGHGASTAAYGVVLLVLAATPTAGDASAIATANARSVLIPMGLFSRSGLKAS